MYEICGARCVRSDWRTVGNAARLEEQAAKLDDREITLLVTGEPAPGCDEVFDIIENKNVKQLSDWIDRLLEP